MKVIRVTIETDEGVRVYNTPVHVAEVSDLQMFVDSLETVALGVKDLMQRVARLEGKDRKLRHQN